MEFGITFKGDISPERTVALCKQAEAAGFDYVWFFDSHVLWPECYTTMAVCMHETHRLRFGPCVTNPGVRDWTVAASTFAQLNRLSDNRFDLGVGRGDSSRRVLGKKPLNLQTMVEFTQACIDLAAGRKIQYEEREVELVWSKSLMPAWFAAYGPKALACAGQHADGLILQLADPWLVKWFSDQAIDAGKKHGKDMKKFKVMAAAPVWVGDIDKGRTQTRWFPAMVGNHVADLVEKYGKDGGGDVPERLVRYVEGRKGYDYKHHANKDAGHLDFISNDIIDSFSVLGDAKAHVQKLEELRDAGVTQFNIYLMCEEEERIVAEYGEHVLPHFRR